MNVDLELPNLIQGAIQERQQLLMQDIRSIIRRVLATLLHHGLVVVTVEQAILPTLHFDGLQAGLVQDDGDDSLLTQGLGIIGCGGGGGRGGRRGGRRHVSAQGLRGR